MTARWPEWLPASAATDLRLLISGCKPAARVRVDQPLTAVRTWARRSGLFVSGDPDGYVAMSRKPFTARRVLETDRRPGRHTAALGAMLGYPRCCCIAAARVGDEGIDALHDRLSRRRFSGRFAAIDPRGYRRGAALISHVPCSHRCAASLGLAREAEAAC